ncbi:MAG: thiamine-phosphate kinase [Pseudomonadota bacterium]
MPGEFDIIREYFAGAARRPDVVIGIGDDAACVTTGDTSLAVCVDALVAGVHFPHETPARAIGHRALAVNLSDLAACGATPLWVTLALAMPRADRRWLADFSAGFFELAAAHDVALIGGDTVRGPLQVTVQAIGRYDGSPVTRTGGRPGDDVYVSGTVGDASGGLRHIARDNPRHPLGERFHFPIPRVALGQALAAWATACIDVSDGLAVDLERMARSSGGGAVLELDRLPMSSMLRESFGDDEALYLALNGGDDYELCFCVDASRREDFRVFCDARDFNVTRIGHLDDGDALVLMSDGAVVSRPLAGFDHFADGHE